MLGHDEVMKFCFPCLLFLANRARCPHLLLVTRGDHSMYIDSIHNKLVMRDYRLVFVILPA